MRHLFIKASLCALALSLSLSSGHASEAKAMSPAPKVVTSAGTEKKELLYVKNPAFKTDQEQLSYSFGARAGQFFKAANINVDIQQYSEGAKDATTGTVKLTPQEIQATLMNFQKQQIAKQKEQMMQMSDTNKKESEAYLQKNKTQAGVKELNGIQYKVVKEGNGVTPKLGDAVTVHYEGTLPNGKVFDSSYKRGAPASLRIDQVIQGWQIALTHMPVGSTWEVVIPAELGYGEQGTGLGGPIGPNQVLLFKIELISIDSKDKK